AADLRRTRQPAPSAARPASSAVPSAALPAAASADGPASTPLGWERARRPFCSALRGEPCAVEGAAGDALGGAGRVEIGGDAAAMAGESGAEDQREVHLLGLLDHALLEHERD